MFSLVIFTEERRVDVVRSSWITGSDAYWPPFPTWSERFENAIKFEGSTANWTKYPVKLLASFGKWNYASD